MGEQLDLLTYSTRPYPQAPGYKARSTSREAARAGGPRRLTLRERVLLAIRLSVGLTADEVAADLSESILSVRPRVAELAAMGEIIDTGRRRPNASGHNAIVWKVRAAG